MIMIVKTTPTTTTFVSEAAIEHYKSVLISDVIVIVPSTSSWISCHSFLLFLLLALSCFVAYSIQV